MTFDPATPLAGRRALVCGASAGIGRATARLFVQQGATVYGLARRAERLAALADELDGAFLPVAADLDDRPATLATVARLLEDGGPIEILVNNTGGPPGGPLAQATELAFVEAFGRHLFAAQALVVALLPGMKARGYGRILNVVSTSVKEPIPNLGVSNTVRGAVAAWAKSWSLELPPGLTINNVLPGYTDTERLDSLGAATAARTGQGVDAVRAAWLAAVPEGRLIAPEETAAALAFLASPAAGAIRGTSLPVDGGRLRSL